MPEQELRPHLFIVIGGTGDLMRRKLLPALYHLSVGGPLAGLTHVLGVARTDEHDDASYRRWAEGALQEAGLEVSSGDRTEAQCRIDWCSESLHFQSIGEQRPEDYRALAQRITALDAEYNLGGNRIFYLSIPPSAVQPTIEALGEAGLTQSGGFARLVIEKPFGRDLASAKELNRVIHSHFDESQTFRIDHYLGKDTVQNLLVLRFANPIFESLWNRQHIRCVQITVAETDGVGSRGGFYEQAGALRDMIQNHMTQVLCLTAMEVPVAFEADAIRDEKTKVLRSIAPLSQEDIVFGQYGPGMVNGEPVPGYLQEDKVSPDSTTETYAAFRLNVLNWRWQGVPFILRTGKRLPRRTTQIALTFRCPPLSLFRPHAHCQAHANVLVITLQPDEGFDLSLEIKAPEERFSVQSQNLHFRYSEAYGRIKDAYETLLLDIARGDATLFVRADEAEQSWQLYTPVLEQEHEIHQYAAGTWGPEAANRLLLSAETQWQTR
ncbi:MAG TPA: glucose-6-phosphate dehydrogenase [Armatimonadetes bacterium]|jgi:glucose-6-phosphate 1-dehydrogenase|nr:glucose-6-phosphate dehydrogenase [Armatimonadota bacterium]